MNRAQKFSFDFTPKYSAIRKTVYRMRCLCVRCVCAWLYVHYILCKRDNPSVAGIRFKCVTPLTMGSRIEFLLILF